MWLWIKLFTTQKKITVQIVYVEAIVATNCDLVPHFGASYCSVGFENMSIIQ